MLKSNDDLNLRLRAGAKVLEVTIHFVGVIVRLKQGEGATANNCVLSFRPSNEKREQLDLTDERCSNPVEKPHGVMPLPDIENDKNGLQDIEDMRLGLIFAKQLRYVQPLIEQIISIERRQDIFVLTYRGVNRAAKKQTCQFQIRQIESVNTNMVHEKRRLPRQFTVHTPPTCDNQ